jgi:hypothetical protein
MWWFCESRYQRYLARERRNAPQGGQS